MTQVTVSVLPRSLEPPFPVKVEVGRGDVCGDLTRELLYSLQLPPPLKGRRGAWHLVECWRGCERRVAADQQVLALVKGWGGGGGGGGMLRLQREEEGRGLRRKGRRTHPRHLDYFLRGRMTHKKLLHLQKALTRIGRRKGRGCSSVLLSRLARGEPLGPREPTFLELMRWELGSLKEENLVLTSTVADLNISTTRLSSLLVPLRRQASFLSERLTQVQGEVMARKEERERTAAKEMANTQTTMLKLKRELDIKNRLNAVQTAKLQSQKEALAKKQGLLAEKRQQLEQIKVERAQTVQKQPCRSERLSPGHVGTVSVGTSSAQDLTSPDGQKAQSGNHHSRPAEEESPGNSSSPSPPPSPLPPPPPTSHPPGIEDVDTIAAAPAKPLESTHFGKEGKSEKQHSQKLAHANRPERETGTSAVARELPRLKPLPFSPAHQHHLEVEDRSKRGSDPSTPEASTPSRRHRSPSTSKKRHHHVFEEKTRQLYEEEGHAFLASHDKLLHEDQSHKGVAQSFKDLGAGEAMTADSATTISAFSQTSSSLIPSLPHPTWEYDDETSLAKVPTADERWYEDDEETSYRQKIEMALSGVGVRSGVGREREGEGKLRRPSLTDNLLGEVMISLDSKEEKEGGESSRRGRGAVKKRWRRVGGRKGGEEKVVRFTPDSVILNAALEGELEVLRKCVKELGSCSQTSDKGATCLHNAVCSGSFSTVQYLVEMGCDINAQDVDGWTPLHCAIAYSNLEMIHYLLENGASLFLETRGGELPLKIGVEEYEISQEAAGAATTGGGGGGDGGEVLNSVAAEECLKYLIDVQNGLGVTNGGQVYAVFNYKAHEPGEISFYEGDALHVIERSGAVGEGWWKVGNEQGQTGYVPSNYLGVGQRYQVVL